MTTDGVPCLVTGGAGFIGRHLVDLLLARGHRVRVLDIDPAGPFPPEVEVRRGSITDGHAVRAALDGVRWLFHLAADPNLWAAEKGHFDRVNFEGTRTVLDAVGPGVERVVFTSTESILFGRGSRAVVDETARPTLADMVGPYCRSKFLAEQAALAAAARGLPVVVVNPTMPIGPGDRRLTPPMRMLLGFVNGRMPAYLDCTFNLVDARDVALGHLLAAERGKVGERYILGSANIRMRELLAMLEDVTGLAMPRLRTPYWLALGAALASEAMSNLVTGAPPVAPLTGVRLARRPMRLDSTRAVRELGFNPRPIRASVEDAVAWLAARGLVERSLPGLGQTRHEAA